MPDLPGLLWPGSVEAVLPTVEEAAEDTEPAVLPALLAWAEARYSPAAAEEYTEAEVGPAVFRQGRAPAVVAHILFELAQAVHHIAAVEQWVLVPAHDSRARRADTL
jgi:hypothetical protein